MKCGVCGGKIDGKDVNHKPEVKGGVICAVCAGICVGHNLKKLETIKHFWDENKRRAELFRKTAIYKGFGKDKVTVDDINGMFYIGGVKNAVYYRFDEVREYGMKEVGSQVVTKRKFDWETLVWWLIFGWKGVFFSKAAKNDADRVVTSVVPINKLVITMESFYGGRTVIVENPPNGFKSFLEGCLK
jgi:hypothetical protein